MTHAQQYRIGRLSHSPIFVDELRPDTANNHYTVRLPHGLTVTINPRRGEYEETHQVPAGANFEIDGASVRYRWANGIILRWGAKTTPAAAIHDWYYSEGRHLIPADVPPARRRLWADKLFLRMMLAAGVGPIRARLGYRAVRLFGGKVWKKGVTKGYGQPPEDNR